MKIKILILVLILLMATAGAALASASIELPRWVLGGGASNATAGSVGLRSTLGQPVVGVVTSSGADVTLGQGFWHGGNLPAGHHYIYQPLVQK